MMEDRGGVYLIVQELQLISHVLQEVRHQLQYAIVWLDILNNQANACLLVEMDMYMELRFVTMLELEDV